MRLELPVPDRSPPPGVPFPPRPRAVLEDRLGRAGLDVFGPRRTSPDDMRDDGDPIF